MGTPRRQSCVRSVSDLYRSARSHEEIKETSDARFVLFEQQNPTSGVPKSAKVQKSARVIAKEIKSTRARTVGLAPLCQGWGHSWGGSQVAVKSCHISSSPRLCRMSFLLHCYLYTHTNTHTPPRPFPCACLFVSLRLRGVERRGHTAPPPEPVHQRPVTSVTSATLWSLQTLLFAAFLFASPCFSHRAQDRCVFGAGGWGEGEGGLFSFSACPELKPDGANRTNRFVLTCPMFKFTQEMCKIHTSF